MEQGVMACQNPGKAVGPEVEEVDGTSKADYLRKIGGPGGGS